MHQLASATMQLSMERRHDGDNGLDGASIGAHGNGSGPEVLRHRGGPDGFSRRRRDVVAGKSQ